LPDKGCKPRLRSKAVPPLSIYAINKFVLSQRASVPQRQKPKYLALLFYSFDMHLMWATTPHGQMKASLSLVSQLIYSSGLMCDRQYTHRAASCVSYPCFMLWMLITFSTPSSDLYFICFTIFLHSGQELSLVLVQLSMHSKQNLWTHPSRVASLDDLVSSKQMAQVFSTDFSS
jgi:hypothetical protein